MVRRRDRQRRLGRRHPATRRWRACTSSTGRSRRGRQARRPADRRHPRRRADPAGGLRPARRSGLGVHRHLREEATAAASSPISSRTPTRPSGTSPVRPQPPATSLKCHSPASSTPGSWAPRPRRSCSRGGTSVSRAHRHRPGAGAAPGPAAAAGRRDPRHPGRRGVRPGGRRGGPHRAAAGERRQPRHQEPHEGQPDLLPRLRPRGEPLVGDLHFSQGDGEITFCGAIEMGGFIDLHLDVIKGGMDTYGVPENSIFMPGNSTRSTPSGSPSPGSR